MEAVFNLVAGANLNSAQITAGHYIQSIMVDNPTGSWLLISADNTFVPPYTIGFAHVLEYSATQLDVTFVNGPAGQLSTNFTGQNDRVRVTLYDSVIPSSGGADASQFVNNQLQPETAYVQLGGLVSAANTPSLKTSTILGGSLTKRIRVYDLMLWWALSDNGPGTRLIGEFQAFFYSSAFANILGVLNINANHETDYKVLSPPITLPVGVEVHCDIYGQIPSLGTGGGVVTPQTINALIIYSVL